MVQTYNIGIGSNRQFRQWYEWPNLAMVLTVAIYTLVLTSISPICFIIMCIFLGNYFREYISTSNNWKQIDIDMCIWYYNVFVLKGYSVKPVFRPIWQHIPPPFRSLRVELFTFLMEEVYLNFCKISPLVQTSIWLPQMAFQCKFWVYFRIVCRGTAEYDYSEQERD